MFCSKPGSLTSWLTPDTIALYNLTQLILPHKAAESAPQLWLCVYCKKVVQHEDLTTQVLLRQDANGAPGKTFKSQAVQVDISATEQDSADALQTQQEIANLQLSLSKAVAESKQQQVVNQQLTQQLHEASSSNEHLTEKLSNASKALDAVSAELGDLRTAQHATQASLQQSTEVGEERNFEHLKPKQRWDGLYQQHVATQAELQKSAQQNLELQAEMRQQTQTAQVQQVQAKHDSALAELSAQLATATPQVQQHADKAQHFEAEMVAAHNEAQSAVSRAEAATAQVHQLKCQFDQLAPDKHQLQEQLQTAELRHQQELSAAHTSSTKLAQNVQEEADGANELQVQVTALQEQMTKAQHDTAVQLQARQAQCDQLESSLSASHSAYKEAQHEEVAKQLKEQISSSKLQHRASQHEVAKLERHSATASEQLVTAQTDARHLQEQLNSVMGQLADVTTHGRTTEAALQTELAACKAAVELSQALVAQFQYQLQDRSSELQAVNSALAESQAAARQAREQQSVTHKVHAEALEAVQQQLAQSLLETAQCKTQLQQQGQDLSAARVEHQQMLADQLEAQQQVSMLTAAAEAHLLKAAQEEEEKQNAEAQLASAQGKCHDLAQRVSSLESQLALAMTQAKTDREQTEQQNLEMTKQFAAASAEAKEQLTAAAVEAAAAAETQQAASKELSAELKAAQVQAASDAAASETARQLLSSQLAAAEGKVTSLTASTHSLHSKLQAADSRAESSQATAVQHLTVASDALTASQAELSQLKQDMSALTEHTKFRSQAAEDCQRQLQQQLQALQEVNRELNSKLHSLQQVSVKLQEASVKHQKEHQETLAASAEARAVLQTQVVATQQEAARREAKLQADLLASQKKALVLQSELSASQGTLVELKQVATASQDNASQQKQQHEAQLAAAKSQTEQLTAQLQQAKQAAFQSSRELQALQERHTQLESTAESSLAAASSHQTQLEVELAASRDMTEQLAAQLRASETMASELQREVQELRDSRLQAQLAERQFKQQLMALPYPQQGQTSLPHRLSDDQNPGGHLRETVTTANSIVLLVCFVETARMTSVPPMFADHANYAALMYDAAVEDYIDIYMAALVLLLAFLLHVRQLNCHARPNTSKDPLAMHVEGRSGNAYTAKYVCMQSGIQHHVCL